MTPFDITIVHIDDEPAILSGLRRALVRGWPAALGTLQLRSFTSAAAALDTLLAESVDVVICDYRMPEMDGVELLRRVRELQPHTGRILLSGTTDLSFLLNAVNHAAVARVLRKPWNDEELIEAVRHCIALRRLQLENADLADQVRVQRGQLSQQDALLRRQASLQPVVTEVVCASDDPVTPLGDAAPASAELR
jgi:two-component system, probable response regulator PhcQ